MKLEEMAIAHYEAGRLEEAEKICCEILRSHMNNEKAWLVLSAIAYHRDEIEKASDYLQKVREIAPNNVDSYNNLGVILRERGKIDEAIAQFKQAIAILPNLAAAHCHLGMALLSKGDLKNGFTEYEWRWRSPEIIEEYSQYKFSQPIWDGSDLQGRTILLYVEQGYGDSIQFIRYVSSVKEKGGRIIVACPQALVRLFQTIPDIDRVSSDLSLLREFDVRASLMSLPHIFGTTLETIPSQVPYLGNHCKQDLPNIHIDNPCIRVQNPCRAKVGIVWEAKSSHATSRQRSCKFDNFISLLDIAGINFYSLQKDIHVEINVKNLVSVGDKLGDFADTAAVIQQLDLIITVDTAVAHLAGAMGKPVWVLLPFAADWRWMLEREDSPWYPTMRLFRQLQPGDWSAVFAAVKRALELLVSSPNPLPNPLSNLLPHPLPNSLLNDVKDVNLIFKQAVDFHQAGKLTEAEKLYRQILEQQPNNAEAIQLLGASAHTTGKSETAIAYFRQAIALRPDYPEAHNNIGITLHERGNVTEAITHFQQAISLKSDYAEAYSNLGMAFQRQGKFEEAIAHYQKAIQLKPSYYQAIYNLGNAWREQRKFVEAIAHYQKEIEIAPNLAEGYNNLAICLKECGRVSEAIAHHRKALILEPNNPEFHYNLGIVLLLSGDIKNGFAEYDWRWRSPRFVRNSSLYSLNLNCPLWQGEDLEGRTILLYCEQGFGDSIQFIRYVPLVKNKGGKVVVICPEPLVKLFSKIPGIDQLVSRISAIPEIHVRAPLMSLPHLLGTTLETIPSQVPYLGNDHKQDLPIPNAARHHTEVNTDTRINIHLNNPCIRVQNPCGAKVGIVWECNSEHPTASQRSCSLADFEPLFQIPDITFYSLQKDKKVEEITSANNLISVGETLEDFADTAAIIEQLDLVITVDTSVAHLAGAMDKLVWVLLPFAPDWRWMLAREDSPWYPTMWLFRQSQPGDWSDVFVAVREALLKVRSPDRSQLKKMLDDAVNHHKAGRLSPAEQRYRQILLTQPNHANVIHWLGTIAYQTNRLERAIAHYWKAISLNSSHAEAHNNLGIALQAQGKIDDAISCYQRAISLNPNYPEYHYNLGTARQQHLNLDGAIAQYKQALELAPNYTAAHKNLGIALLLSGDLKNGFIEYEWRWKCPEFVRQHSRFSFSVPRWNGEYLQGRTILLYAEQGLGDAIQFTRYAPLVKQRGGNVIVQCQPTLAELFATIPGIDRVIPRGKTLPDFQVCAPLMSLPHILGTTLETIPAQIPYLGNDRKQDLPILNAARHHADGNRDTRTNIHLDNPCIRVQNPCRAKVGIVWKCNADNSTARQRSCSLADFLQLLDIPGIVFYSLQKGKKVEQQSRGSSYLMSLGENLETFSDTAAVISQLDLVITVDTAVAHLAGAMGKLVWVLLPFAPDWRWMLEREDSPWYPTMRLFRQSKADDWLEVFQRLKAELKQLTTVNNSRASSTPSPSKERVEELLQRAVEYQQTGKLTEARELLHECLTHQPDNTDALYLLGAIAYSQNQLEEAIAHLQRLLTLKPNSADSHNNLAVALQQQGKLEEASIYYQQAIALNPNSAEYHYNLAIVLQMQGNLERAIERYQQAIALNPNYIKARHNLGSTFKELGDLDSAIECYQQVISLQPDFGESYNNLGTILREKGDLKSALDYYQKAVELQPDNANTRRNFAMALLLAGDLKQGFAEYEWRWKCEEFFDRHSHCHFSEPLWDGSGLQGRTILLYTEQGFGDALQFIRYVPLVAEKGGKVIVQCPPKLMRLFATVSGIDQLVTKELALPEFQVRAPLMSLPHILGTTLETIPSQIPYLGNNCLDRPCIRVQNPCCAKVGIVWATKPNHPTTKIRSCQLQDFLTLLDPDIAFYSLQKGPQAEELQSVTNDIISVGEQLNDFADTAVVISQLDLIITVDTAVAHLAGAMGKPVWILLPFDPDWRWMLQRQDSPWYPTMRLFRQSRTGEWSEVLEAVRQALQSLKLVVVNRGEIHPRNRSHDLLVTKQAEDYSSLLQQRESKHNSSLETARNYQTAKNYNNSGNRLQSQGRFVEAIASYQQAIALRPNHADTHYNLGNAFRNLGNYREAIARYQQAIVLNPNHARAYHNIGITLQLEEKFAEAIAYYQQAVQLKSDYYKAYHNLAIALEETGNLEEAISNYKTAISLAPNYAKARNNLGMTLLRVGDLKNGFTEYEWRWQCEEFSSNSQRYITVPLWDGTDLQGRTILIYCEQGLGDAIQFIRYVSLVKERGGRAIVECPEPLRRLFATIADIDQLITNEEALPEFDVRIPLMSLPHILGTTLETIPAKIPYLEINRESLDEAPDSDLLKVGIVWRANKSSPSAKKRSCNLKELWEAISLEGLTVYSLQKECEPAEIQAVSSQIISLGEQLNDFADTAAIIGQLDLIITADTAVAHLAGALGKTVWVLLPYVADWRWMLARKDSPWYPTMRLFRQTQIGDWSDVFVALREALISFKNRGDSGKETAVSHYQQAAACKKQGKLDEAIAAYQQAIALRPDYIEAYNNLANLLQERGRLSAAIDYLRNAIDLQPNYIEAHLNLGMALLRSGDLKNGFTEYEWRWKKPEYVAKYEQSFGRPRWDGSNLQGQTILLYCEQGLGDSIQFIRYVFSVRESGGKIIVACPRSLKRLFATITDIEQLICKGDPLPDFQVCAPLMSLPHILGTTLETIPNQVPYLGNLEEKEFPFPLTHCPSPKLKVGIVWECSAEHPTARQRSCRLADFMQLLDLPGITFYSLQKDIRVEQAASSRNIIDVGEYLDDFADTAAIVDQLDLVITVDTAVAHLAGAMGKPVWVLLPFVSDWRWMLECKDSPWYPTARLFSQSQPEDWSGVFVAVRKALLSLRKSKKSKLKRQKRAPHKGFSFP